MKDKLRTIRIIVLFILFTGGLIWITQATLAQVRVTAASNVASIQQDKLSTPQLIEAALANGEIDQNTANLYLAYAFGDYEKLPTQYRSNVPWSGTLPLLHLQEAVQKMSNGAMRATIERILTGICYSSTGSLPNTRNSTNFHIQYDTIGGGLNINDYETSLATTWTQEVDTFGWAAPPVLSGNPPPGNRYHVRIDTLGGSLYGYVSSSGAHAGLVGNNPNTTWNDVDAYASCMVLNRDYSGFPGSSQQALDATTAHEFNHSIQYGYGALTGANVVDAIFAEGGATWTEDEVFDSADDNYNYLWPDFSMCMGEYTASPYPYWITFRGLTERYGTGSANAGEQVMQDFWEETSQSTSSNMLTALDTALVNKGTNLADAYHVYAIAAKFNKSCSGGYGYPYCFEEGANYVAASGATSVQGTISSVGNSYNGSVQDNYALNWVSLPTSGAPYTVTLQNTSSGGQLRASVVCDTGSALNVNALPSAVGPSGSSTLTNFDPSGCSSVVAVITNQSQTAANPTSCTSRNYTLSASTGGPPTSDNYLYLPTVLNNYDSSELLQNGDFDTGAWTPWLTDTVPVLDDQVYRSASYSARLAGRDNVDSDYVYQAVMVPANATEVTLDFWYRVSSNDSSSPEDYMCVEILDSGGSTVLVGVVCYDLYLEPQEQWLNFQFAISGTDLTPLLGQTVLVSFQGWTNAANPSTAWVDDVSFKVTETGP